MASGKKHSARKKKNPLAVFFKTLIIFLCVAGIALYGYGKAKAAVEKRIAKEVVNSVFRQISESSETAVSADTGTGDSASEDSSQSETVTQNVSQAEDFYESMDTQDQETVETIVSNHTEINAETISQVTEYVNSGDTAALKEYASNQLSEEEQEQLKELYLKYAGQ